MSLYKNTKVWGSSAWMFLHCISYTYPEKPTRKEKNEYKKFLHSLQYVLPCSKCREHTKTYFKNHPVDEALESRDRFICYLITLRNYINVHYKKQRKINIKDAKRNIQEHCENQL